MKTLGKFIHRLSVCLILVAFFNACSDDDGNGIAIRKTFDDVVTFGGSPIESGKVTLINSLDELETYFDYLRNKTKIQEIEKVDFSKYSLICVTSFERSIWIKNIDKIGNNKINVRVLRTTFTPCDTSFIVAVVMIDKMPEGTSVEVEFYDDLN